MLVGFSLAPPNIGPGLRLLVIKEPGKCKCQVANNFLIDSRTNFNPYPNTNLYPNKVLSQYSAFVI